MPPNVDTYSYMHTIGGMSTIQDKALNLLINNSLRTSREFKKAGIDGKTLQRMTRDGHIIRMARGLYASSHYIPNENHSLIEAHKRIGNGVVCLLSALSYHDIGTQNPSLIWMALPRKTRKPNLRNTPVKIVVFSESAHKEGFT
jgi:predicted transcriptional regulator of viral defense system